KREAVWWGCVCVRQTSKSLAAPQAAALTAAEKWSADPSDANRRAALTAGEAAGLGTPPGAAALGAFAGGGRLAPPDVPVVAPPEHLTALAVGGAVQLAAVITEPEKADEKRQRFIALGYEVEAGSNRWKEAGSQPGVRR